MKHKIHLDKTSIINLKNSLQLSYRKLGKFLNKHFKTIWNWCNTNYTSCRNNTGRPLKLHPYTLDILKFIHSTVCFTQTDLQQFLLDRFLINVHQSTISRFLKKHNITYKKITKIYSEKKTDYTIEWKKQFALDNITDMYSLDECGFVMNEHSRYGYAEKGHRASIKSPGNKGKKFTLLLCVSSSGKIIKYDFFEQSLKTDRFLQFIKDLDKKTLLDNASVHKAKLLKTSPSYNNLYYLPPYEPELNPTEHCFSILKNNVRKIAPRTQSDLEKTVIDSLKLLTTNKIQNMFNNIFCILLKEIKHSYIKSMRLDLGCYYYKIKNSWKKQRRSHVIHAGIQII